MCFGPSDAEVKAAEEQRKTAESERRQEVERLARAKREDIQSALTAREVRQGRRGGSGRRSLLTGSGGASGYHQRF